MTNNTKEIENIESAFHIIAFDQDDLSGLERGVELALVEFAPLLGEDVSFKELKKGRTLLNKLTKAIDDKRKDFKAEELKHYEDVNERYKDIMQPLEGLKATFKEIVDTFNANEKQARESSLAFYVTEKVEEVFAETGLRLDIDAILAYVADNKLLKASDYKDYQLTSAGQTKVDSAIVYALNEAEKREEERHIIRDTALKYGIVARPYLDDLGYHRLSDILELMEKDAKEYEAIHSLDNMADDSVKYVDSDTGEIVEQERHHMKIAFTLTPREAMALKEFLEGNNMVWQVVTKGE